MSAELKAITELLKAQQEQTKAQEKRYEEQREAQEARHKEERDRHKEEMDLMRKNQEEQARLVTDLMEKLTTMGGAPTATLDKTEHMAQVLQGKLDKFYYSPEEMIFFDNQGFKMENM